MSVDCEGELFRERGVAGVPEGCAGWRSRGFAGAFARVALGLAALGLVAAPAFAARAFFAPLRGLVLRVRALAARGFAARALAARGFAARALAARGFAARSLPSAGCAAAGAVAVVGGVAAVLVAAASVAEPELRAARFSLRRCGRVRGSEPRTSGGRSSLIESMIAHRRTVRVAPQAVKAPIR
jgi:hypothetical protein